MVHDYNIFWMPCHAILGTKAVVCVVDRKRNVQEPVAFIQGSSLFIRELLDVLIEGDHCTHIEEEFPVKNKVAQDPIVTCSHCKQQYETDGWFHLPNEEGFMLASVKPHTCEIKVAPEPEVKNMLNEQITIPITKDPRIICRGLEYDPGLEQEEICHCGEPLLITQQGFVANGPYLVTRRCSNEHSKIRRLSDYSHQEHIARLMR